MRLWLIGLIALLLALTACSPAADTLSSQSLPTIFPSETPEGHDLESANRVAVQFLDAWQRSDFDTMYSQLTFASQEAYPFETFKTLYENAQQVMSLESLSFVSNALQRESEQVAVFNYSITFVTQILGEFTDAGRNLRIAIDEKSNLWRIAWTPANIFAEMEGSGALRLERFSVNRGNIYDRSGEVVLADQQGRVATVNVIKGEIPDYDACVSLLVETTGRSIELVQAILNQAGATWDTEIGVIEPKTYVAYRDALEQTCGARFNERFTRQYPNGTLAPHVIGYVGYPGEDELTELAIAGFNQDSILGRTGVEASWDEVLRGKPGGRLIVVSPDGIELREVARMPSQPQQSVWLTIDADLQQFVTQVIGEAYAAASGEGNWGQTSKGAAVVVIDVNTGEILAMVSWPIYDLNALTPYPAIGRDIAEGLKTQYNQDPRVPLLNRATQGVYPSGSVMKTMDTIAVVDSGVYDANFKYTCTAGWNRDIPRRDWTSAGHGTVTTAQALTGSCNPFFYELGYQMDIHDQTLLPAYAKRLGLGVPTGMTDIVEESGLIPDPEWKRVTLGMDWTFSDAVNMSIGQGEVQITPLQIARLFSYVANGSTFYKPQLVKQVGIVGDAPSYTMQPEIVSEVNVSALAMSTVREGLCNVTTDQFRGTAEFVFRNSELQLLGVCAKTGTAEDPANTRTHAWFAAYAPRETPQIAVAVIVENAGEGSGVAAPILCRVMQYYFFGTKEPCI